MPWNDLRRQPKMVLKHYFRLSELCTLYFTYVFWMPYSHLSFCHMRKIIQHTAFLFNFTLCTRTKEQNKTHIFHQRPQKIHLDLNLSLFPLFRLNTILVTNRWNRSHLSWIFPKFLTFTLHTFVLTQMCPSPSLMLSRAYFEALKWLQTQINIGEMENHTSVSRFVTSIVG